MKQCKNCSYSATDDEIFTTQKGIFGRVSTYCILCSESKQNQNFKQKLLLTFLMVFCAFLMILGNILGSIWLPIALALVPAFITISVFFHEFSHMLIAKLVGLKVFFVTIGSGKPYFKFKLLGIEFDIRGVPFSGYTGFAFNNIKGAKYKQFLVSSAGPLMNGILVILPFFLGIKDQLLEISLLNPYWPVQMFVLINLYIFLCCMWPKAQSTPMGKMSSDGKRILSLPSVSRTEVECWPAVYYTMEAKKLREAKEYEAAERVVKEGLAKFPDNPTNLNDLALVYLETTKYHEASQILNALLERKDIDSSLKNIFANNIAWIDLIIGSPDLIDEADRLSAQAYQCHSRLPSIMSTRGWVLIERGEVEEGVFLLQTAFERTFEPREKAIVACCLAMGEVKLGHIDKAKLYVHLAKRLDSVCVLLVELPRLAPVLTSFLSV